jgi:serine/threonine protein kinase
VEVNIDVIHREQDVYRRLSPTAENQLDGVVPYIQLSPNATHLVYMPNGDLRVYLEANEKPPASLQLSWFRQMARALEQIHDRRVLAADIASRNFLLDSDLSIKFCDFTEASVLPLEECMDTADDNGYSIQTDIGQLGTVMYEVVTGG